MRKHKLSWWNGAYSRADFAAIAATIFVTLAEEVEVGLMAGVALAIFLHLYRTSRPHVAVVGQIPGTATFRNVEHHAVVTDPEILSLRVDESLYFPNARFVEDRINAAVAANTTVRHVILECPAMNAIDASGARGPGSDQPSAQRRRNRSPSIRSKGPDHGPPETVALPRRADRQGSPQTL